MCIRDSPSSHRRANRHRVVCGAGPADGLGLRAAAVRRQHADREIGLAVVARASSGARRVIAVVVAGVDDRAAAVGAVGREQIGAERELCGAGIHHTARVTRDRRAVDRRGRAAVGDHAGATGVGDGRVPNEERAGGDHH